MSTNQRLVTYLREVKGERVTAERAAETEPSVRLEPTTADVRGIHVLLGYLPDPFQLLRAMSTRLARRTPINSSVSRGPVSTNSRDPPVHSHPLHPASLSQDHRKSPHSRPLVNAFFNYFDLSYLMRVDQ
jgi:hypothetical protein